MSKCHIVGNHMSRLKCLDPLVLGVNAYPLVEALNDFEELGSHRIANAFYEQRIMPKMFA